VHGALPGVQSAARGRLARALPIERLHVRAKLELTPRRERARHRLPKRTGIRGVPKW
jgi:hypothetical protein